MHPDKIIETASKLLDVKINTLTSFSVQDPYNPNVIEGAICQQGDYNYGALVITSVNDIDLDRPYRVFGMPKIGYPFTYNQAGQRIYHWPANVQTARAYEKLDGTNIVVYRYPDSKDNYFVTAKTRLAPILGKSRFGNFKALWDEVLEKYPRLRSPGMTREGDINLALELYGYKNPHLVKYDTPIDTRILAMIDNLQEPLPFNRIYPPASCLYDIGFPVHKATPTTSTVTGLTQMYEELRKQAHQKNKGRSNEDPLNSEGYVLYLLNDNGWTSYKAEPEEVEEIAWRCEAVPKHTVQATCWKALESYDKLTTEIVAQLLAEDYSKEQIGNSTIRVEKIVSEVQEAHIFNERVATKYREFIEKEGNTLNKAKIMRYLSKTFRREEMNLVYNALVRQGIFPPRL